jgi:hypothetical protein
MEWWRARLMDTIQTASGKKYPCPQFATILSRNRLYVGVTDMTFTEAAELFSNKDEMKKLTFAGKVYSGFTKLDALSQEVYGYLASLSKET